MQGRCTGLWRQPDFLRLWAGQTVSLLGSQVTFLALPLIAALTLKATPAQMGILRAAEYAPMLLMGLFAGVWVDRMRRRPILIGTDLARAVLLVSLPIAALFGLLRTELLYAVALLMGILAVFFALAYSAFLPSLVPHEHLVEGNSKLETSNSVAQIAGPGLAGLLVQALTAPFAVTLDAFSFLVSALFLSRIRVVERAPLRAKGDQKIWGEIGEGLRMLAGHPLLRAFTASSATLDIFWNALMAVYFLYVTRDLGLPATTIGIIFGIGSIGSLLGSLLARRVARRFGLGPTIVGAQFLLGLGGLLIALAVRLPSVALPLLTAAELVQSCMNSLYTINRISLSQVITPDRLRGRVNASSRFVNLSLVTVGALAGGVLGNELGVRATIIVCAFGGLLAFVWLFFSPVRSVESLADSTVPISQLVP